MCHVYNNLILYCCDILYVLCAHTDYMGHIIYYSIPVLSKNTAGYESYNSNWEYKFFNFYNKLYMWAPNNKLIIFNNILLLPGTCIIKLHCCF